MSDGHPPEDPLDREFWREHDHLLRDMADLKRWRQEREEERDRFRGRWSDADINRLKDMLNGWAREQAVKGFLDTTLGRIVAFSVLFASMVGALGGGLAILLVLGVIHHA